MRLCNGYGLPPRPWAGTGRVCPSRENLCHGSHLVRPRLGAGNWAGSPSLSAGPTAPGRKLGRGIVRFLGSDLDGFWIEQHNGKAAGTDVFNRSGDCILSEAEVWAGPPGLVLVFVVVVAGRTLQQNTGDKR